MARATVPVIAGWRVEGVRDALCHILHVRFPGPLPAELCAALETQTDPDTLASWVKAAAVAPTLQEFRVAVRV